MTHSCQSNPEGGGSTPLYKVYRYVPPQRVWFFSRFGLKTGIDFDNYGLKSGLVFGAGNIYESLQTYFSSQYVTGTTNREREKEIDKLCHSSLLLLLASTSVRH